MFVLQLDNRDTHTDTAPLLYIDAIDLYMYIYIYRIDMVMMNICFASKDKEAQDPSWFASPAERQLAMQEKAQMYNMRLFSVS